MKGFCVKASGLFDFYHVFNCHSFGSGSGYFSWGIFPFFYPFCQTFYLLLLFFVIFFLFEKVFFLALYEGGVISRVSFYSVIFDFVSDIYHPVQKHTVVRNDYYGFIIFFQIFFQPFNGGQVKVVGGFVQEHNVRSA